MVQSYKDDESCQKDIIDRDFYLEPIIKWEQHYWIPVILRHHPECPCHIPEYPNFDKGPNGPQEHEIFSLKD